MLTTMSWAVTAWPPVGGLGGRIAQTPTHSLNFHEHTHTQTRFHTDIDTRTETHTHYLNSLDFV